MSYMALYRKFRPAIFADVKGQDAIVTTLQNQIKNDRIGHAYLFTGTRGTGKTTVAKIFARAINCTDRGEDGSPCGKCPACQTIASGASMDVIEIDGASNNGVENARSIIEEVAYPPAVCKYKVYIIDEVHMMTREAFNALLKTIEEPPAHAVFIMATTEVHKVPNTIRSRCQRYDFRRISIGTIADRMKELLAVEKVEAEDKALSYIARTADGSMRDALSLLDECIAFFPNDRLTYEGVLNVLGAVDIEIFSRLHSGIIEQDGGIVIRIIDEVISDGREIGQFVTDFIWYLRNLLLIKNLEDMEDILNISADNIALMKQESEGISEERIMYEIRALSELSAQLRSATQKRVLTEIALLRLTKPEASRSMDALEARVGILERKLENGIVAAASASSDNTTRQSGTAPAMDMASSSAPQPKPLRTVMPDELKEVLKNWNDIIRDCDGMMASMLAKVRPYVPEDKDVLQLVSDSFAGELIQTYFADEEHKKEINSTIDAKVGAHVPIEIVSNNTVYPKEQIYPDAVAAFAAETGLKIETENF